MRVAVIVPTANDDAALQRSLACLGELDPAPDELIVVDSAASPSCALTCRAAGAVWIPAHAGRGGQLALGAARARADVLWFLHTDCEPSPGALTALRASIAAGVMGGYFRFQFSGTRGPAKRFLERCIAWRCRLGTVYGEQGLYVTRRAYARTPGFSLQPLFEQVALVRALRRSGRFVALDVPIIVSPRRWEREGYWRRTLANRLLALGYLCGIAPARLARWTGGLPARPSARLGSGGDHSHSGGHQAGKG
jgi:glycosyltransferase involved in cell wall biosynthesis